MSILSYLQKSAQGLALPEVERRSIRDTVARLRIELAAFFPTDVVSEHFVFGSFARGTKLPRSIDRASDVDYMVVFTNANDLKPQTLLTRLRRFAEHQYGTAEIYQAHPTLTMNLNHVRLEIVPAYRTWLFNELRIPSRRSSFSEWTATDPINHVEELQEVNSASEGLAKQSIRLMKYWNAVNDYVLPSYEIERMILSRTYWGSPGLVRRFFNAVIDLGDYDVAATSSKKVQRAIETVRRVEQLEELGFSEYAEMEIQNLIPTL